VCEISFICNLSYVTPKKFLFKTAYVTEMLNLDLFNAVLLRD